MKRIVIENNHTIVVNFDFMINNKRLADFTNLFTPNNLEKMIKLYLNIFYNAKMEKIYYIKFNKKKSKSQKYDAFNMKH